MLPPLGRLVELTAQATTTPAALAATEAFFATLGMAAERVGDAPGLVLGRIVAQLLNEACFAIGEGVGAPDDVDAGMVLGLNHPRGPLRLGRRVGPGRAARRPRRARGRVPRGPLPARANTRPGGALRRGGLYPARMMSRRARPVLVAAALLLCAPAAATAAVPALPLSLPGDASAARVDADRRRGSSAPGPARRRSDWPARTRPAASARPAPT